MNTKELSSEKTNPKDQDSPKKPKKIFASFFDFLKPLSNFLKNKIFRYVFSFLLVVFVIYLYIVFESNRNITPVKVLFFFIPTNLIVPLGLMLALIAVLYISWDDAFFKKYRTPALYMVVLTAIFYTLIYTGLSEYLFETSLAKWLTRFTAIIVVGFLRLFGFNIVNTVWDDEGVITTITINSSNGVKAIGINAACSGIHSLTVFTAIFILMLFESRKRLRLPNGLIIKELIKSAIKLEKPNWLLIKENLGRNSIAVLVVSGVTILGILGTYLLNLFRVGFILALYYDLSWTQLEPIHNYMGYIILILWLPVYWLFILPIAEKPELKKEKKKKKEERKRQKVKRRQEKQKKQVIDENPNPD